MYIDLQEYEAFRASPFLDEGVLVRFPRRVLSVSRTGSRVRAVLETIVFRKQPLVISALMYGRDFHDTGQREEMCLTLDFYRDETVRLQLADGRETPDRETLMVAQMPPAAEALVVTETPAAYEITAGDLTAVITKEPYSLTLKRGDVCLYQQYLNDLHNVTNDRRRGHTEGEGGDETDISLQYPGFECFPFGTVENPASGERCFTESVRVSPGEAFYGFGERFSPLDKNGQELLNWVINPVGVSNSKAYKCVPFFYSSAGYGVYYNTARKIRFSMCSYYYKAYEVQVSDNHLDLFLFAGNMKTVLGRYSRLTGLSTVPPRWAFGVWMSRNCYMTQDEVESVADRLNAEKLPCDVMHIDWAYCKTWDYDFAFDTRRFPDVGGMAAKLLEKGIRLSVWQLPYIKKTASTYANAEEHGYLAREADGRTADTQAGEAVIDFSNPEAVRWYQGLLRGLLEQGIRVIKTDFGENAQDVYRYHALDGKDMHNLYPLLYNKAAYEVCQEVYPGDSLVWGRSAYAGSQRYPVCWGGDSDSDYSGMYHSLRGGLSLGLSGFPFWSHDVGGYFCTPDRRVYIRWMQFGMLSPLVRFHGTSDREPWAYGPEAEDIYRRYAGIRYSLAEYLYSQAGTCVVEGLPMLRALVLEYPDDPGAARIDDQYLLGSQILVAPVFSDEPVRKVYLPEGNVWYDFFTGQCHEGGRYISREVPLDIMPIYYRGGTATPRIKPGLHINMTPPDTIIWDITPDHGRAAGEVTMEGRTLRLEYREEKGVGHIQVTEEENIRQQFRLFGKKPAYFTVNEKEAETDQIIAEKEDTLC